MINKNFLRLVLVIGLLGWIFGVQEVKAVSTARLYWGSPSVSLAVGEKKTVSLMIDSGSDYVSVFSFLINFGSTIKVNRVDLNSTNFAGVLKSEIRASEFELAAHNSGKYTAQLPKGVFEVARVEIEGVAGGVSYFGLKNYQVVGNNGETTYFSVNYEGMTAAVEAVVGNGIDPILKYKIKYGSVSTGKCAVNWPVQVIVLGSGSTKVYNQVIPQKIGLSGVYGGTLQLSGFTHTSNVAVFIKGPKHLQMKYGIQNQSTSYDKAGGELTLTTSAATSPEYDFTGYSMLPGDVVGNSVDDGPNGVINGVDFSYLKNRPNHESVAEGGYLKGDLDGNCQINTNDVNILKISLETKQGELY